MYRLQGSAITRCAAPEGLLAFLEREVLGHDTGPALLAVDVGIGLPAAYPEVYAGHSTFVDWLVSQAGKERDAFVVRGVADQSPAQPFVDRAVKGDKARGRFPLRACDRRAGAESLYWCVGGKQVGKAALQFWLEVLIPLLQNHREHVAVWPFEPTAGARLVVAESYPGLVSPGVWGRPVVKSRPADVVAAVLGSPAARRGTDEATRLHAVSSEDDFDAFTLCLALRAAVEEGRDVLAAPSSARPLEGWILLLDPA